jgi:hypothetical protein
MRDYAQRHSLGKPTLLIADSESLYGIALDWRDYRRAFSFRKGAWTGDDFEKLCNAFRAW